MRHGLLIWMMILPIVLVTAAPAGSEEKNTSEKEQMGNEGEQPVLVLTLSEDYRDKIKRLMREGNFFLKKKYYRGAFRKAEEVLRLDPENKEAILMKIQSKNYVETNEEKILREAHSFFKNSEYAAAVNLYNKLIKDNPQLKSSLQPMVIKSYFNLGVRAQKSWNCGLAADYFRQVLFVDSSEFKAREALEVARDCNQSDFQARKFVALMKFER